MHSYEDHDHGPDNLMRVHVILIQISIISIFLIQDESQIICQSLTSEEPGLRNSPSGRMEIRQG
jgi:hypothetical protein